MLSNPWIERHASGGQEARGPLDSHLPPAPGAAGRGWTDCSAQPIPVNPGGKSERRKPRVMNGLWEGEREGKDLSARKGCPSQKAVNSLPPASRRPAAPWTPIYRPRPARPGGVGRTAPFNQSRQSWRKIRAAQAASNERSLGRGARGERPFCKKGLPLAKSSKLFASGGQEARGPLDSHLPTAPGAAGRGWTDCSAQPIPVNPGGESERRKPRVMNGLWEGEREGKDLSARKGCPSQRAVNSLPPHERVVIGMSSQGMLPAEYVIIKGNVI
ncbi:hypothetical protein SAMN02745704_01600 [Paucidesulfovibrio gracilis DSM 16080]|uniref:Uncharacterized protein n=1 Tax=Paucidesulfovibrio gracilis DSM 16080 TaxID=1121449 RepID=A0A1T4X0L5_9BACT|nr:hypothetical protein SAMN02745704_01600 [Paucidesulfovibrio gracilis DSM 16080]